ncbi:MAG: sulfite oxidase [Acidobacteriaceae bacterium]
MSDVAPGLILRETEPDNLEYPFSNLEVDGPITPNGRFYIRDHFNPPEIDRKTWRLSLQGAVAHSIELSLEDIKTFPRVTHTALLECSGNSRAFLTPKKEGVAWELGGLGCARWTGVSLATILDRAGVNASAVEIVLEGADHGTPEKTNKPKGEIHYAHSLPMADARRPEVLLAYEMNGEALPDAHGGPLRAIVPGWYAMASVKWLRRILVMERPFHGYFQTVEYAYWAAQNGAPPERVPITRLPVKSQIARPAMREVIAAGSNYRVFGAAWAADSAIAKVEVSSDGGKTWGRAKLLGEAFDHAWRLWEFEWQPKDTGTYTLLSRATDAQGHTQPAEHDQDHEAYIIHHTLPITVMVEVA